MSRGKAINVKIATTKVIKALETKLAQLQKDKANQKVNEEKFSKAQEKYNKEIAKATDLSAHKRYNGEISVSFTLPAGSIELPDEPTKDFDTYHDWQYKEMVEEIENAIRILKMTDEEVVSTSTYNAIARYL